MVCPPLAARERFPSLSNDFVKFYFLYFIIIILSFKFLKVRRLEHRPASDEVGVSVPRRLVSRPLGEPLNKNQQ
jgi:hypothetical protein